MPEQRLQTVEKSLIVKRVGEAHNGELFAQSDGVKGTRFTIGI